MRHVFYSLIFISSLLFADPPYLIGAGISDITGVASGVSMMGYANPLQIANGIHTRLYARAFIIEDKITRQRIVFVSADLGMIFESVKQGVMARLYQHDAMKYQDSNVMLSATHTHSGPGGYALNTLYNITTRGFHRKNYEVIVNGIVSAILQAEKNLEPGNIYVNQGELIDASRNRSLLAYVKNPEHERGNYQYNTDKEMLLLKFVNGAGQAIGMINWFAVHGVSMSNTNTLISGDNKGVASYLFEKEFNQSRLSDKPFVAAFAQANEGDATPNIFGTLENSQCFHFDCEDFKRTVEIGRRQYQKAKALFENAKIPLSGRIEFREHYIDMRKDAKACHAALGYSFAAGTTDGAGAPLFYQGELKNIAIIDALGSIIAKPSERLRNCQLPKPVLLAVGDNKPHAWVPDKMPVQLFKIGQLAIIGAPGEFTTMSGRRIKKTVLTAMPDVSNVAFAGLSNSYAGYVTTKEEYAQQNYEGGFTVFGPNTLEVYQEGFLNLAMAMQEGVEIDLGEKPEVLSDNDLSLIPPVLFDDVPPFKHFGDTHISPLKSYHAGDVVHVAFWAGDARNNREKEKSFLEVQYFDKGVWRTLYHDWDLSTIFRWQRIGLSYAYANIYWQVSENDKPGVYRIIHHGHYRFAWDQKVYAYQGATRAFEVT